MPARALLLIGPTASGKSEVALELARLRPAEIISVDSAQVYRGMDIGTAKPGPEQRRLCPHHLIDIRDIDQPYSAADFRRDALALITAIDGRGRLPLLAGGTMLYARALRRGLDELPAADPGIRRRLEAEAAALGWPALHARLARVDPRAAARLAPGDSQRVGRALEIYLSAGRPPSELWSGAGRADESIFTVALVPGARERLRAAIGRRLDDMLARGLLDEVARLMADPRFDRRSPAMRCVGYRQAVDHLLGETDAAEFRFRALCATRQLAKRQLTWLRGAVGLERIDPDGRSAPELAREVLARFDAARDRDRRASG